MDSQRLHEGFREEYQKRRKRPYGESHPYDAFIPKRFEDLRLNGGSKLRRIPIKLNYHRSRFKKLKSKSPRRTLDSKGLLDRTFQRRCVGMKKQYHQKKRTAQVKLAQACKSLGMFLVSPSFRDPKDCMKICVVKRQIIDTGVRPETHLFWYEFTSHEPTDIDGHVDTRIGDQSIFAEDVTALEHDDPDAAMESVKDETVLESEPEVTSNDKIRVELSEGQQQKEQRRFHKVRFKGRRHRKALYTRRVVLQKKLSVNWSYHKSRKKELINLNIPVKALRQLSKESDGAEEIRSTRLLQRFQWEPGPAVMLNDNIKQGQVQWLRLTSQQNGDINFSLGNAETSELCERVDASVIDSKGQYKERHRGNELYIEVKRVDVLGLKRSLASQKTNSSDGVKIMGSAFVSFSLEDKTVLLPGRKLRLCGEKIMDGRFEGLSKEKSGRAAGLWRQMRKVIFDAAVMPLYLRLQRDEGSEPMIGYEWDPGGVSIEKIQEFVFNIKCCLLEMEQSMKKCSANSELELLTRKVHHMKAEGADSNHGKGDALVVKLEKRLRMVQWVEQGRRDNGARIGTMRNEGHIVLSTSDTRAYSESLLDYGKHNKQMRWLLDHTMTAVVLDEDAPENDTDGRYLFIKFINSDPREKVVFFVYDWFQSPRPPEMNHDKGGLGTMVSVSRKRGLSQNIGLVSVSNFNGNGMNRKKVQGHPEDIVGEEAVLKGQKLEIAIIMKLTRGNHKLKIQEGNSSSYNLRTSWIFRKGVLIRTGLMKMGQQLGFVYFIYLITI